MTISRAIKNAASGVRVAEVAMDIIADGFAKLQVNGGKVSWAEAATMGTQTVVAPGAATEEGANGLGIRGHQLKLFIKT